MLIGTWIKENTARDINVGIDRKIHLQLTEDISKTRHIMNASALNDDSRNDLATADTGHAVDDPPS